MLSHLHIRNFAIIDEVELDFSAGMTVVTGETGAGKSILLDALGLVLGDRADSTSVQPGARRAEVTAEFELPRDGAVGEWLTANELDDEDHCVLRRTVAAEGRSKGFINGRPAPLGQLRELGEQLVDIHGQHEHQSLRHREAQRALLDDFGAHADLLEAVRRAWREWRDTERELADLSRDGQDIDQRLDLLSHQVDELDALELRADELGELDAEQRRLAHAGQLLETCQRCLATLHEDEASIHTRLSRIAGDLEQVVAFDAGLEQPAELVDNARIQAEEAASGLRAVADRIEMDPARLEWVEQRLASIHELARKHQVAPEDLPATGERLRAERDALARAGERGAQLRARVEHARDEWIEAAAGLSAAREEAGKQLGAAVTAEMQALGMGGGRFEVELRVEDNPEPAPEGADRIEFRVTANPGQAPLPLRKVASGGELSRISLAIQMIGSRAAGIPTQIFDEVDAGIGGKIAAIVGTKLRALADQRQVLCVTHLPQVAARAHQHMRVLKHSDGAAVATRLDELSGDSRVEEVARMLGGERITDQSRAHAREMLAGEDRTAGAQGTG